MGVNKVIYYGEVLVDMSQVTVTPDTLNKGETALDASGDMITGNNPYEKSATDSTVQEQASLISQISAALEGKAAGGGASVETCVVTLDDIPPSLLGIAYNKYTGGQFAVITMGLEENDWSNWNMELEDVVKGTCLVFCCDDSYDFSIEGSAINLGLVTSNTGDYMYAFTITGDCTIMQA